jgi:NAD+ synthase (glutamine-hydrolysing)
MRIVRVAGACINQTPLDFSGNVARIKVLIQQARAAQVDVICFPELSVTGYGCEDAFFGLDLYKRVAISLEEIAKASVGLVVIVGAPWLHRNQLYNCAFVMQDGAIIGANPKKVLAREGVHYEPRWFSPWNFGRVDQTTMNGKFITFGDVRYQFGGFGMAVEICEEAWGDESAAHSHVTSGVELVVNPSASHFSLGKDVVRKRLVTNWSRALKVNYCYANLLGLEAGRLIYDGSVLIAEAGELVAESRRFAFGDGFLTTADVDMDRARAARIKNRSVREHEDSAEKTSHCVAGVPVRSEQQTIKRIQPVQVTQRTMSRDEEFIRAESLALFDYMRKSRSKGYVVSLSGGVDSSVCASLVAHMICEARRELGAEVFAKMARLESVIAVSDKELISKMLVCIYQATDNSGQATRDAAKAVANELGATFYLADVQSMVAGYSEQYERLTNEKLSWSKASDDLAMQNIQARVRSPLPWMFANTRQMLLITTSNRSESAVGYATMDGDMAGGLAPLAGIDKAFLRTFLSWMVNQSEFGLGPVPALKAVSAMPPTAELRPKERKQSDEDDLMPYAVMAKIERYFVADKRDAEEMCLILATDFPDMSESEISNYVNKFIRLWRSSQWKRERVAPSFHIDDFNLDPRSWCRYPILSGG